MRAVFLDRDGVIIRKAPEGRYLTCWKEVRFLRGVSDAISLLNRAGFRVIIVTNQRCVAKGLLTTSELESMHQQICDVLRSRGANIHAVRYCPHELHPPCNCRKPKPGMLVDAAATFGVDLAASWMIGDADTDVQAGKNAGCKTVRILRNTEVAGRNGDVFATSLLDAVHQILEREHAPTPSSPHQYAVRAGRKYRGVPSSPASTPSRDRRIFHRT